MAMAILSPGSEAVVYILIEVTEGENVNVYHPGSGIEPVPAPIQYGPAPHHDR
jgi:hypothetical protein